MAAAAVTWASARCRKEIADRTQRLRLKGLLLHLVNHNTLVKKTLEILNYAARHQ